MYENIAIILLIIVVFVEILVLHRILTTIVLQSIAQLDASIAEALKTTVENLPEALGNVDIEPMNPIQGVIAQFIQSQLQPQGQIKEISRSEDGKFNGDTS
tara:strand:- start:323 stop:625 length:303 start_codon:yes stop_codon:yes gene_type:complete